MFSLFEHQNISKFHTPDVLVWGFLKNKKSHEERRTAPVANSFALYSLAFVARISNPSLCRHRHLRRDRMNAPTTKATTTNPIITPQVQVGTSPLSAESPESLLQHISATWIFNTRVHDCVCVSQYSVCPRQCIFHVTLSSSGLLQNSNFWYQFLLGEQLRRC